jgi:hypothetical protein
MYMRLINKYEVYRVDNQFEYALRVPTKENAIAELLLKNLLKPKSPNLTVPCAVMNTFAGLRSLCITRLLCIWSRALHICKKYFHMVFSGISLFSFLKNYFFFKIERKNKIEKLYLLLIIKIKTNKIYFDHFR